jgi:hypothetical protein
MRRSFQLVAAISLVAVMGGAADPPDGETLQQLQALGYLDSAPTSNPEDRGVTVHLPGAFEGLNLYSSREQSSAQLIDMDGEVLHSWSDSGGKQWMHVEMLPEGDLLAIAKDHYLVKLDWDSRAVWRHATRAHHDLALASDGRIFLLSRALQWKVVDGARLPFLADRIEVLSPEGEREQTVDLLDLLYPLVPRSRLQALKRGVSEGMKPEKLTSPENPGDLIHVNSIEILARPIDGVAPKGAILLSVRELDRVVILNPAMDEVLWHWGQGELQRQHHASLTDDGHILVFDNGVRRRKSRLVEIDPLARGLVWSLSQPRFFTGSRGAAQRLPNRNHLVTESDVGRVFEVTAEGKVVWEFFNPAVKGKKNPERDAIYRLERIERSYLKRTLPDR